MEEKQINGRGNLKKNLFLCNMESLCEKIWRNIASKNAPGFFITAEIHRQGSEMPEGLEGFIDRKLVLIHGGLATRRFVFQEGAWRIYLTFFPTNEVVEERYALKNKVVSRGYK